MRSRNTSQLCGVGSRAAPFNKPELEAPALCDLEAFVPDLAERRAKNVLALRQHGDDFGGPLDGADRLGPPDDAIGPPLLARAQHPVHLADHTARSQAARHR